MSIPIPVPTLPRAVTGSMTYRDYLLEASREFGYESRDTTTGLEALPTDAQEIADCRLAVVRGLQQWNNAHPSGWRVLSTRHELALSADGTGPLNIDSDPARYVMPWWFHGQKHASRWIEEDAEFSVMVVDEAEFEAHRASNSNTTASPCRCVFRKIEQDQYTKSGLRGWEVVFSPAPSQDKTLNILAEMHVLGFGHESDVFVAGEPYDRSLRECVRYQAAMRAEKPADALQMRREMCMEALQDAIAFDRRSQPVNCGTLRQTMPIERDPYEAVGINRHVNPNI